MTTRKSPLLNHNEKEILEGLKLHLDWIRRDSGSLLKAQETKIKSLLNFIKLYAESFLHTSDSKRRKWLVRQFILEAAALNPELEITRSRYRY